MTPIPDSFIVQIVHRKPKPVFRIRWNRDDTSGRFPYALHHAETDDIVEVCSSPEQCSAYAFRNYGDGIEVRHDYLEGA